MKCYASLVWCASAVKKPIFVVNLAPNFLPRANGSFLISSCRAMCVGCDWPRLLNYCRILWAICLRVSLSKVNKTYIAFVFLDMLHD